MPYRRQYRSRRPYYARRRTNYRRRRPRRSNAGSYASMALSAFRLAKKVAYLANTEVKYDDTTINQPVEATGTTFLLNGISLGDTEDTRDGMSVKQLSVDVKLTFNVNPEQLEASTVVRYAIIHDKQSDGAIPALTDWLDTANVNSFRNLHNGKRFRVLLDRRIQLNNDAKDTHLVTRHIPFVKHIRFSADGDTQAAIASNALWLICLGSSISAPPFVTGFTRVRYVDN